MDEHGEVRGRRALGHVDHALEALAPPDELLEAPRRLALPQHLDLLLEPPAVEGARHHHLEFGHLQRLGEEIVGPAGDGVHGDLPRPVRGHHDDRRLRGEIPAARDGVEPVHIGQPHVEEDQVVGAALELVEEGPRGRSHLRLVALARQRLADDEREVFVVFGDEDAFAHGRTPAARTGAVVGSSTMKVVADTPSLATWSRPRWASTICRAMGSPSPVPRGLVVKKGWKMRSRISSGIPAPEFSTRTRTCSPSGGSIRMRTRPLEGAASRALSIRLPNTSASRKGSPHTGGTASESPRSTMSRGSRGRMATTSSSVSGKGTACHISGSGCERVRRFSTRRFCRSTPMSTRSIYWRRASPAARSAWSSSRRPRMAASGVRISWAMRAAMPPRKAS